MDNILALQIYPSSKIPGITRHLQTDSDQLVSCRLFSPARIASLNTRIRGDKPKITHPWGTVGG